MPAHVLHGAPIIPGKADGFSPMIACHWACVTGYFHPEPAGIVTSCFGSSSTPPSSLPM